MPNHFLTVGLCTRDWNALEKAELDDIDFSGLDGEGLCQKLMPMPEDLEGIQSSNPQYRYIHKTTGDVFKDGGLGPQPADQWGRVSLTPSELAELKSKHGAVDWYEWNNENWGTKWGIYRLSVQRLGGDCSPISISFESAWGPPNPQMMKLIELHLLNEYYLESITWMGHDPSTGEFAPVSSTPPPASGAQR